ncbi:MAG: hypothetical protein CMF39_01870 [Legionellaceae bacterium]|nr:hypothetical protein [Legionellaceae bacterium]|tara:strand:- start:14 stop:223 length:210 start_codon:yes stop_codon:yes gene_type:complete
MKKLLSIAILGLSVTGLALAAPNGATNKTPTFQRVSYDGYPSGHNFAQDFGQNLGHAFHFRTRPVVIGP